MNLNKVRPWATVPDASCVSHRDRGFLFDFCRRIDYNNKRDTHYSTLQTIFDRVCSCSLLGFRTGPGLIKLIGDCPARTRFSNFLYILQRGLGVRVRNLSNLLGIETRGRRG